MEINRREPIDKIREGSRRGIRFGKAPHDVQVGRESHAGVGHQQQDRQLLQSGASLIRLEGVQAVNSNVFAAEINTLGTAS